LRYIFIIFISVFLLVGCKEQTKQSTTKKNDGENTEPALAQMDKKPLSASQVDSSKSHQPSEEKLKVEPALKRLISKLTENDQPDSMVKIIGKFANITEDSLRSRMSDAGVTVGTVVSKIFTAECPAGEISKLADMKFIEYLELAKKRKFN